MSVNFQMVEVHVGQVSIRTKWPIRPEFIAILWHEVTRSISTPPWMGC